VTVLFDPEPSRTVSKGTAADAIMITHQHPDTPTPAGCPHCWSEPAAKLYADPQTAAQLGGDWQAVHAGDSFALGHLTVRGVGGTHAVIHPEIPVIDNTSYVIGDADHPARFMHPGDALFVPGEPVDVLAPRRPPVMKVAERSSTCARGTARAVPIHKASSTSARASSRRPPHGDDRHRLPVLEPEHGTATEPAQGPARSHRSGLAHGGAVAGGRAGPTALRRPALRGLQRVFGPDPSGCCTSAGSVTMLRRWPSR
jgi:hypothetical protein